MFHSTAICLSFLFLVVGTRKHQFKIKRVAFSSQNYSYIIFTLAALVLVLLIIILGFQFNLNFDIRQTYIIRGDFKEEFGGNRLVNILIQYLQYVIAPLLLCIGLFRKNITWISLAIFCELYIYSITSFKTAFFLPLFIFVIAKLSRKIISSNFGMLSLKLLVFIFLFCILIDGLFFSESILYRNIFSSLFLRRTFVMPGLLTNFYMEYFNENGLNFMSNSFFGRLIVNLPEQYNNALPKIIGLSYFGSDEQSANANFLADAYANFGIPGMFIYSFLVSVFLKAYDTFSNSFNPSIGFPLVIVLGTFFTNSALLSCLIGHGGLFLLGLMYFYSSKKKTPSLS